MKFAHISDIHLGLIQYGSEKRKKDMYEALRQAIDISIQQMVDFVIFSGDIFNTPKPDGDSLMVMANQLKRLKRASIKSYFVLGEHDISRIKSHPVPYVYHKLEFMQWVGNGEPVYFNDVMIAGHDKMRPGELDELKEILDKLDRKAAQHQGHRILVLHQGLKEINEYAGELTVDDLPKNFTYYAMGHLHDRAERRFAELGGPLAYPGSTERTDSEKITNDIQKGFFIVDISGDVAVPEWHRLNIRRHVRIEIEYDNLVEGLEKIDTEGEPIVHIVVRGKNVRFEDVQVHLRKIVTNTLTSRYTIESDKTPAPVLLKEPTSIDAEILRLARNCLKSDELADFAVKHLLVTLSDRPGEAGRMVIDRYERFGRNGS